MVEIRIVGVDRSRELIDEFHEAIADALSDVIEACLQTANLTVPIEEGTLSDSGATDLDRKALQGQVTYGTPYAVYQHQTTGLRHDPGRRDHWLELTVYEHAQEYFEYIAEKVRRDVR